MDRALCLRGPFLPFDRLAPSRQSPKKASDLCSELGLWNQGPPIEKLSNQELLQDLFCCGCLEFKVLWKSIFGCVSMSMTPSLGVLSPSPIPHGSQESVSCRARSLGTAPLARFFPAPALKAVRHQAAPSIAAKTTSTRDGRTYVPTRFGKGSLVLPSSQESLRRFANDHVCS